MNVRALSSFCGNILGWKYHDLLGSHHGSRMETGPGWQSSSFIVEMILEQASESNSVIAVPRSLALLLDSKCWLC